MPTDIRVACFQRREICGDPDTVVAAILKDVAWAEDNGADLCLFPESFLQGYPHSRADVHASALRLTDSPIETLLTRLGPYQPTVVVGFIEASGTAFYNSALVMRAGECLGVSRKRHPNEAGICPGEDTPLFNIGKTSFGISICNDANYPETLNRMAKGGADIILAPLNNMLPIATADTWRHKTPQILQMRAQETGCWVASADVIGTHDGYKSYGCTAIVSPDGDIIEKAPEGVPGAIIHTLAL
ncbi:carbon-nitrogen hydrolase family protein [Kordiimonas marina]|uniref:carbon-nitrogen hydrolase family protein n=1 Tax=Kordiimonas marina TaxID=2872312 RepID=UPI001FF5D733|nr:carbon-nitrogen hydrolase family protein [Kordiimonas marina]MCJ9428969.1 carbon-nitrogen hydrolase family protein [Kordiimonas marina]